MILCLCLVIIFRSAGVVFAGRDNFSLTLGSCAFEVKNKKLGTMTLKWPGTDFVNMRAPIPPHARASEVVRD